MHSGMVIGHMNELGFNRSLLDFDLDVSVTLGSLHLILHATAIAAIVLSVSALYLKVTIGLCIVLSLVLSLYRYVLLRHPRSVLAIRYREPSWSLRLRSGEEVSVRISGQVLVTSFLLVVNFVDDKGRRFAVPMFRDSISAEQHRRDRVFFNMQGGIE